VRLTTVKSKDSNVLSNSSIGLPPIWYTTKLYVADLQDGNIMQVFGLCAEELHMLLYADAARSVLLGYGPQR
jgi:hypothetical protein